MKEKEDMIKGKRQQMLKDKLLEIELRKTEMLNRYK